VPDVGTGLMVLPWSSQVRAWRGAEVTDLSLPTVTCQACPSLSARSRRRAGDGLAGDPGAVRFVFRSDLPCFV